jgi:hypothetical protein
MILSSLIDVQNVIYYDLFGQIRIAVCNVYHTRKSGTMIVMKSNDS